MPREHVSSVVDALAYQGYGEAVRFVSAVMGIDFDAAIPIVDEIAETEQVMVA